ncbi:hypothetical protein [Halobacteriovorax sp. DA5]|uniref:hypothetical protein n=1 Tax=Halobacteriovorax sp. DA5 TaxID=2067553 RepID=UPI000CD0CD81|nr:hypothetical protein [Halobacteriovorax sp. DA5]POB12803.1 hypothetical protein C0Z22_13050 [Halobacteriovorax sp. DA5]
MKRHLSDTAVTLIVSFALLFIYSIQVTYFGKKYYEIYVSEDTGFIISEAIIINKKEFYKKKIKSLKKSISEFREEIKDKKIARELLLKYKIALEKDAPEILDNLPYPIPNDILEIMKKCIDNDYMIPTNFEEFSDLIKKELNDSAVLLKELSGEYSELSKETF